MNEFVSEELFLSGFDNKIANNRIVIDTVAGDVVINCSEKTVMGNVYRAISHVGLRLHKWGLEHKLMEIT